ncbi:MAG: DNA-binding response regulator [Bacteroidetes bacterium]|nr:MAG: DNA-binding response regulator [Bacteroidota bacterium]
MNPDSIYVALVEDDPEIRQLIRLILEGSPGFCCAGVFEDAASALKKVPELYADVLLMDIGLPDMSGIDCVSLLKEQLPGLDIIMLTVQEDQESVFQSLCAGATGYLVKETPPAELLAAIEEARRGGAPMSSHIARKVIQSFHQPKSNSELSEREMQVLRMLCDGHNYKTIAEALFISTNTVKAHIKHIYKKMQVNTRAAAVKKALRNRLVD